jgi:hypothetical protein
MCSFRKIRGLSTTKRNIPNSIGLLNRRSILHSIINYHPHFLISAPSDPSICLSTSLSVPTCGHISPSCWVIHRLHLFPCLCLSPTHHSLLLLLFREIALVNGTMLVFPSPLIKRSSLQYHMFWKLNPLPADATFLLNPASKFDVKSIFFSNSIKL